MILWKTVCEFLQQGTQQTNFPLFLRLGCTGAFGDDLFFELRFDTNRQLPVLFHSTLGRKDLDFALFCSHISLDRLNPWLFLKKQYLKLCEFEWIQTAFLQYKQPPQTHFGLGRDGCCITLESFFDTPWTITYYNILPVKYENLNIALCLLADYLPKTERLLFQSHTDKKTLESLREQFQQQQFSDMDLSELKKTVKQYRKA